MSGNELVNASGAQVVLHGVNRSGTEYECVGGGASGVQGRGIFDGPSDQSVDHGHEGVERQRSAGAAQRGVLER